MSGKKFHVHIEATTPEQLQAEVKELANILTGLRETTKVWQNSYGSRPLQHKVYWETKADQWINDHKIIIEQ